MLFVICLLCSMQTVGAVAIDHCAPGHWYSCEWCFLQNLQIVVIWACLNISYCTVFEAATPAQQGCQNGIDTLLVQGILSRNTRSIRVR